MINLLKYKINLFLMNMKKLCYNIDNYPNRTVSLIRAINFSMNNIKKDKRFERIYKKFSLTLPAFYVILLQFAVFGTQRRIARRQLIKMFNSNKLVNYLLILLPIIVNNGATDVDMMFPPLPVTVMKTTNTMCKKDSDLYAYHLNNFTLWAHESR